MTASVRRLLDGKLKREAVLSLLQSMIGIISYFLAMRLLIAEQGTIAVGLWSLTVGTVAIVRLVDISGGAGLARLVSMLRDDRRAKLYVVDTVSLFILGFHLVIVLIAFFPLEYAIARMVPGAQAPLAQELIAWAALILIATVVAGAQANAVDGLHRVETRSKIMLAGSLLFGGVALFAIPRWGVRGMALAQLLQTVAVIAGTRAALMIHLPGLGIFPRFLSLRVLRDSLPYGAKMQASSVPILIYEPLARVIVNHLAGLQVLANYDLAYKLCVYSRNFIQAAAQPLVPALSRLVVEDGDAARQLFKRSFRLFLLAGVLIFAAIGLASPLISYVLLGRVSPDFVIATIVMAMASVVGTAAFVPSLLGQATGHLRWNIIGQWSIAILTLTIIPLVAYGLGADWVIIATAIAVALGYAIVIVGNIGRLRHL
jgi:O-antigen/teichoic acid export membrane protein